MSIFQFPFNFLGVSNFISHFYENKYYYQKFIKSLKTLKIQIIFEIMKKFSDFIVFSDFCKEHFCKNIMIFMHFTNNFFFNVHDRGEIERHDAVSRSFVFFEKDSVEA